MIAVQVNSIQVPTVNWLAIAPEIALAAGAVLVVLSRALLRRRRIATPTAYGAAAAGLLAAGGMLAWQWIAIRDDGPITTMHHMVRVDGFGVFLGIVVVIATALAALLAVAYIRREQLETPEYLALLLLSSLGMVIMTTANNLVVVFVSLEILSIPLYALSAFDRRRLGSQEAGMKYFVLGAFSSAIFLYGVALVYGATGTTSLSGIATFLARNTLFDTGTLLAGMALLLVGLGFKVAAAPFHTWTPDVYQGAPTPVTAFMAAATKAAAFAALLRIFGFALPLYRTDWRPAVWVLAVLTLAVGSIGSVVQTDVKRLLAYSSIAHAGYVLMAFQAATPRGREAAVFYLFVYAFMVLGSFGVVVALSLRGDADHSVSAYRGLAFRHPVLGTLFVFFLLAQAGIPLTGGFIAKLEVFEAAASAGEYALVAIGAVATVVAAFAYLRVALSVASPLDAAGAAAGEGPPEPGAMAALRRHIDGFTALALAVTAGMTLVLGVVPEVFVHWAHHATFAF